MLKSKNFLIFYFLIFFPFWVKAQESTFLEAQLIPGRIEGRGTYFEIQNSPYLNISLESSEEIDIILESIPRSINLTIEPSSKNSTILILRGLEPKKVYYKYQDTYQNGNQIVADEEGAVFWFQDLTQKHYIWIQEEKGTLAFPRDCPNWDETNSVCTLVEDVQHTIEILASDFTLDCNFKQIKTSSTHGIYINGKNNVTVKNCLIESLSFGIYAASSTEIKIENNSFFRSSIGIYLAHSSSTTIENNVLSYDLYGIRLENSSNNFIQKNKIISASQFGVYLFYSPFNVVKENTFLESGFFVFHSYQNLVEENIVNGKPLIYLEEKENVEVSEAGQIVILNSKNIKVEGLSISNANVGIELWQTEESQIINNNLTGNLYDVFVYSSKKNQIIKNNFSSQKTGYGIYFFSSSENKVVENTFSQKSIGLSIDFSSGNLIEKNIFLNNVWYGILFASSPFLSKDNVIIKNTISGHYHGIRFEREFAHSNLIYLNNFSNNTLSIYYNFTPSSPNIWNSTDTITYSYQGKIFNNHLGNYWQDYLGEDEDGDGIGDSTHSITSIEKDNYPLISPFENYSEVSFDTSSLLINYFPKEPAKGAKVVFSASSSLPLINLEWKIASTTFYGENVEFVFKENGDYQITLTVTDANGLVYSTSTSLTIGPFSFAVITDLHIGRHYQQDYGGEEYYLTQRLRNVVDWINKNKGEIKCDNKTCPMKLLVILGDITENTPLAGFCKAKEILDELEIPYVPVFGNHDVGTDEEYEKFSKWKGQDYFDKVFWSKDPPCENASSTKNFELLLNELNFQRDELHKDYKNFSFSFGGINFIGLDFNSRERFMKFGKGVGSDAVLNEINKGWLEKKIEEFKEEPVILLAHHPMMDKLPLGPVYAFSPFELLEIRKLLDNNLILFNFSGHIHSFEEWHGKFAPKNANIKYDSVAYTNVLTTEALMVGSNGRGIKTIKENDKIINGVKDDKKGIIRIVKVFEKDNIDPYNWETTEKGDEFLAFNPKINLGFSVKRQFNNLPCVELEAHKFSKKPSYFVWKFGESGESKCNSEATECYVCYQQAGEYIIELFAKDKNSSFEEKISKKINIKEGIIPRTIKKSAELINNGIDFISDKSQMSFDKIGQVVRDKVKIFKTKSSSIPIGEITVHFENLTTDLDLTSLIVDTDIQKNKTILYMENWPNEIERSKILFLPLPKK